MLLLNYEITVRTRKIENAVKWFFNKLRTLEKANEIQYKNGEISLEEYLKRKQEIYMTYMQ